VPDAIYHGLMLLVLACGLFVFAKKQANEGHE
jgi:hypothetical protein